MRRSSTKDKSLSYIRALVHGESGMGKTTSLSTLPEDCTVIASAERGLLPLRGKNYEVLAIESWPDVQELYRVFREPYMIGDKPAKVLAIDSLSEVANLCKRHIIETDRKALVRERTNDKRSTPEKVYDDLMTQEDWGLYGTRMGNLISAFCHLPVHVIMTSLSAWTEDKKKGTIHVTPNLNGRLALECPAFFDLVLNMQAATDSDGNAVRQWQTFADGQIVAKDASGVLDPYVQPSWTYVFKKILNGSSNIGGGK